VPAAPTHPRGFSRWWTYQRERFPLAAHGPLVVAFALAACVVSARLRGAAGPDVGAVVVAAVSVLGLFFQLRVADEFKDAETDRLHRPYRPVPRGLVTLRDLAGAGLAVAALQLGLALLLDARLVPYLLAVWGFAAWMRADFFAGRLLKGRPLLVLLSHGLVVPLIALYAAACDFVPRGGPPDGLGWFLAASFFAGNAVEVGRKVRAPADEEAGVETYSAAWGLVRATGAWVLALTAGLAAALATAGLMDVGGLPGVVLAVVMAGCVATALRALNDPAPGAGTWIERAAAVWVLALYLALGPLALLLG
jgi:4-hydroxybenzoate polyprenyltransferase